MVIVEVNKYIMIYIFISPLLIVHYIIELIHSMHDMVQSNILLLVDGKLIILTPKLPVIYKYKKV